MGSAITARRLRRFAVVAVVTTSALLSTACGAVGGTAGAGRAAVVPAECQPATGGADSFQPYLLAAPTLPGEVWIEVTRVELGGVEPNVREGWQRDHQLVRAPGATRLRSSASQPVTDDDLARGFLIAAPRLAAVEWATAGGGSAMLDLLRLTPGSPVEARSVVTLTRSGDAFAVDGCSHDLAGFLPPPAAERATTAERARAAVKSPPTSQGG